MFNHDDRVGPLGEHPSRRNLYGLALVTNNRGHLAHRDLAHDLEEGGQRGTTAVHVLRHDGITVHRGAGIGRENVLRVHVPGERKAHRVHAGQNLGR